MPTRYVYFIRCGASGPIKIGSAYDVAKRIVGLQTAHFEKLTLLGSSEVLVEFDVHERFADLRMRGEWFSVSRSLLAFIDQHCQTRLADDVVALELVREEPAPIPVVIPDLPPLARALRDAGMPQNELARRLKTSQGFISEICHGLKCPNPEMAKAICSDDLLGRFVTFEALLLETKKRSAA